MKEKNVYQLFEVSLILKAFHAVLEVIGGAVLFSIPTSSVVSFIYFVTQSEVTEDPNDILVHYILGATHQLSASGMHFAALYLLSHGIIKLLLVIGLLKKKVWAYPWSMVVFSMFIVYQLYRFTFTHSLFLIILSAFDLIIIWLIWHEYRKLTHMEK